MNTTKKERLKKFYKVQDDFNGQHGTDIEEVKMTESEFRTLTATPQRKGYALFRTYQGALYYICD